MVTAREIIWKAEEVARSQGYNQSTWSKAAGKDSSGQTVSRMLARGECYLSTFIELLEPLGYEISIRRKE